MKLAVITVCHAEPEIIAYGLIRFFKTAGYVPDVHLLVDNAWPVNRHQTSVLIDRIASGFNCHLYTLPTNIGGHPGFNAGLYCLKDWGDFDFVLLYDPDSNPITEKWLCAMVDVMLADPQFGYLSLMPEQIISNRQWEFEQIGGHKVALHSQTDMFNVTLFRKEALTQGLLADCTLYGKVEVAMQRHVDALGMKHGYLFDFREGPCPIPHPEIYTRWKREHAGGTFKCNFDEYIQSRGLV